MADTQDLTRPLIRNGVPTLKHAAVGSRYCLACGQEGMSFDDDPTLVWHEGRFYPCREKESR